VRSDELAVANIGRREMNEIQGSDMHAQTAELRRSRARAYPLGRRTHWLAEKAKMSPTLPDAVTFPHERFAEAPINVTHDFLAQLWTVRDGGSVALLDVGANDGQWGAGLLREVIRRAPQLASSRLTMVEPQPRFRANLSALARSFEGNATFVPMAAYKSNQSLTFYASKNTHASSLSREMAGAWGAGKTIRVQGFDLAEHLFRVASPLPRPPRESWQLFVKVDVEGAEYELLPWLLTTGALCLVDFLLIEWHQSSLPAAKRLSGFGLRHSIEATLQAGCRPPLAPPKVTHQAPLNNNLAFVPGLQGLSDAEYASVPRLRQHAAELDGTTGRVRNHRVWSRLFNDSLFTWGGQGLGLQDRNGFR
jgi:FkbM family methyltransferase